MNENKERESKREQVIFNTSKNFDKISKLGQGGAGSTFLLYDRSIEQYFAMKKYTPADGWDKDELYKRFVDEIKILYKINHSNIVRIFTYYLYPRSKVGYIQMEYVEGKPINEIEPSDYGKSWDDYFIDAINAFHYLSEKKILHRDIRPQNLLVDKNGDLKIIDFGFGKYDYSEKENSVELNWPASTPPEEISHHENYDEATELYYLGNLFKHLTADDGNFSYRSMLKKMNSHKREGRYSRFSEIREELSKEAIDEGSFTGEQRRIYVSFADTLLSMLYRFTERLVLKTDIDEIRKGLARINRLAEIEDYIYNSPELINCFVASNYKYSSNELMQVDVFTEFYKMFIGLDEKKQLTIVEALGSRFKTIKVEEEIDIPF